MKIKVNKNEFASGLQKVENIVGENIIPVLSNVLLKAEDGNLTLISTDMDRRIRTSIKAEVEESGAITLPAKKLMSLVSKYDNDEISFSTDGNSVKICCGRSKQNWISIPVDEFPKEEEFEVIFNYSLKAKQLFNGLKKTTFASGKDGLNLALQSVCFVVKEEKFNAVATDGKRLSLITEPMDGVTGESKIVIPIKTAVEIKRLIGETDDIIELNAGNDIFNVIIGDTVLQSKVVKEEYANYEKSMPKDNEISIEMDAKELLKALERVIIALEKNTESVYLNITEDKMLFAASSTTVGRNDETIDVEYKGEEMNISFNPCYLIEMLKAVDAEKIHFKNNTGGSAIVIDDCDNLCYVFMPTRDRV